MAYKDELEDLTAYLRHRFNSDGLKVHLHPSEADTAEVQIADGLSAPLLREDEDNEVSYQLELSFMDFGGASFKEELPELIKQLRGDFNTDALTIRLHPKKPDMGEIYIGEEFVAPVYREEDDGEITYKMQMAILDFDIEEFRDGGA